MNTGQKTNLCAEIERELILQIRAGGVSSARASKKLCDLFLPRIRKEAHRYSKIYGGRLDDLIQDGYEGFWVAVTRFDLDSGNRLWTYALPYVKKYIRKESRGEHDRKEVIEFEWESGQEIETLSRTDLFTDTEGEYAHLLGKAIQAIPGKEAAAISQHYLLGRKIREIAGDMQCSNPYVAKLLRKGKDRIKLYMNKNV